MRGLSKIIRFFAVIVYILLIMTVLLFSPMAFGYKLVIVMSDSMVPTYPVKCVIYCQPAEFEEILPGDIITFKPYQSNDTVTHRVVSVEQATRSYITKGDHNPRNDVKQAQYHDVIGKASEISVPLAGYLIEYVKNWIVLAVMAAIIIMDKVFTTIGVKDRKYKKNQKNTKSGGSTFAP